MILDLIINKSGQSFLQTFRHGKWDHGYGDPAAEIYYSSKSYLITGGGIYADGRGKESSYAMPITLMPASVGIDWQEFIRIEGGVNVLEQTNVEVKDRANMGVAPGFACGRYPVIPEALLQDPTCRTPGDLTDRSCQCARQVGKHWTFINYASTKCGRNNRGRESGFYVAVWQWNPGGVNYGFFAVVEVDVNSRDYPFNDFIDDVIQLNGSNPQYLPHSTNMFRFPPGRGPEIHFTPDPMNNLRYGIESIGGIQQETDIGKWALADGQIFVGGVAPQPGSWFPGSTTAASQLTTRVWTGDLSLTLATRENRDAQSCHGQIPVAATARCSRAAIRTFKLSGESRSRCSVAHSDSPAS